VRRWEKDGRWEALEFGSGTRRRPIGRDYAVAKDAECGMTEMGKSECGMRNDWNGEVGMRNEKDRR
jgi:hypothetical protein